MASQDSGARADVLDFYRELPFNYRRGAADHAAAIRRANSLNAYPPLTAVLKPGTRLLDVGCGAGWLVNSAAYHHKCRAAGIDFNPVAVERAREVARSLGVEATFEVADLFAYRSGERFAVVTSIGVLHHTDDCLRAVRHLATELVAPGGFLFLGLYHRFGRKPFMAHFSALKSAGADQDALYAEFCKLEAGAGTWEEDETYLQSWFRDQVLHPHETAHTLAELLPLADAIGLELTATSVNRFARLPTRSELLDAERELENAGRAALQKGRYFPGFFVVMLRKR